MEYIQTGDLNNDFRTCLSQLMEHGMEAHPRGTTTKELLNYNITLKNPRNRIITFPERNTSMRYLLGEFIWYANGSNLPDHILPYAKFWDGIRNSGAEPGYEKGTINSNYGNRLFGFSQVTGLMQVDQWADTIELLKKDKDSRQAIMNIHMPADRHPGNADVPCLAGDTVLRSPEGDITIKDLVEKFSGGMASYPLYSWNEETQETRIENCTAAWKTGKKRAIKITFDDGTSTTMTHDHIVWKRRMVYDHGHSYHIERPQTRCGELRVGDVLCSVPTFMTGEGRRGNMRCSSSNYSDANRVMEHRLYAEHLFGDISGMDVHHHDDDKTNNRASNLEILTAAEHSSKHRLKNNPVHRETALSRLSRRLALRATYEEQGLKVQPIEAYLSDTGCTLEDVIQFNIDRAASQVAAHDYTINSHHKMLVNMMSRAKKTITDIEEVGEIDVYDFTTPINHNCVLDNGLIVHNCTLTLHWFIRENRLCLIVNMRSNDVILGFTNDVFQFTMLQEAMMLNLRDAYPDLELGYYFHNVGSMHAYSRHFDMIAKIIQDVPKELEMIPMDAFNPTVILALKNVEREWVQSGMKEDFPLDATTDWAQLTPYWQTLMKAFFLRDEESLHIIFGH